MPKKPEPPDDLFAWAEHQFPVKVPAPTFVPRDRAPAGRWDLPEDFGDDGRMEPRPGVAVPEWLALPTDKGGE